MNDIQPYRFEIAYIYHLILLYLIYQIDLSLFHFISLDYSCPIMHAARTSNLKPGNFESWTPNPEPRPSRTSHSRAAWLCQALLALFALLVLPVLASAAFKFYSQRQHTFLIMIWDGNHTIAIYLTSIIAHLRGKRREPGLLINFYIRRSIDA